MKYKKCEKCGYKGRQSTVYPCSACEENHQNQLPVYIADGINVEDTVMEKIKALCLVKNFYGIKENREVSILGRK